MAALTLAGLQRAWLYLRRPERSEILA